MKLPRTKSEVTYAKAQGWTIYTRRKWMGLTRKELAALAGLTDKLIYRIEMGDATITAWHLAILAKALQVGVEELCPRPDDPVLPPQERMEPRTAAMLTLAAAVPLRTGGVYA